MPNAEIIINGPESFAQCFDVSRETLSKLDRYANLLLQWQKKINLIGSGTIDQIWNRHIADCAQLTFLPNNKVSHWLDIGSGAGLPGIIVAICAAEKNDFHMHLVESNGKKCAFMRAAIRETQINATVHHLRCDEFAMQNEHKIDVITARALTSLENLLQLCEPFYPHHPEILFQKGQDVDDELTQAAKYWNIQAEKIQSKINNNSSILRILDPVKRG